MFLKILAQFLNTHFYLEDEREKKASGRLTQKTFSAKNGSAQDFPLGPGLAPKAMTS